MGNATSYASGNWMVRDGEEDEFIARWREFLEWTRDNAAGFQEAFLIRDLEDEHHFISFARWDDLSSQKGWRSLPEFEAKFGACSELCDEARGAAYAKAVSVS